MKNEKGHGTNNDCKKKEQKIMSEELITTWLEPKVRSHNK
jgi:hypothetical protein